MRRFSFPLFWKFTVAIIFIVVLFGSVNIILIRQNIFNSLEEELDKRAKFIAQIIAAQSVDPLLIDDIVALQKLVDEIKRTDSTINYAFILSGRGKVLVHTLENDVPQALIEANTVLASDSSISTVLINLKDNENRLIRDLAIPILDKSIGIARIGLEEKSIQLNVTKAVNTLLLMVGIFLIAGILGALGFAFIITNPIKKISSTADKIDIDALHMKPRFRIRIREKFLDRWGYFFRAEDEIDLLVRKFNDMIERLEKTYDELQTAQSSLLQSEKLASIGILVAGIAHEVNNPIAGIQNCIRRISQNPENLVQTKKYLTPMTEATNRIEKVIQSLLNFSRQEDFTMEKVDLSAVIENALLLVGYRLEKLRIGIEKNMNGKESINGSRNRLVQVILNLMINSIDAIQEKMKTEPEAPRKIIFNTFYNENNVHLILEDTGIGIAEQNIRKIFDPFFTTKEAGKGTGLGLSICYNIIIKHNGEIKVRSTPGKGASFELIFPKYQKS